MQRVLLVSAAALCLVALAALAQRGRSRVYSGDDDEPAIAAREAEFHFIRIQYTDLPEYHRGFGYASRDAQGSGWWLVDWPDADNHFTRGIQRLTKIDTGDPRHLRLTDDRIFDYPWIYATQTGWWGLSDAETARLREYLLRGGFLVTDDMWGADAWEVFRRTMERVLPGHAIPDLEESDPVMHVLYDIRDKDRTFIPGSRHLWRRGNSVEVVQPPGSSPAWTRDLRRPQPHGGLGQLRYRYRRRLGVRRRALLSRGHDRARLPLRHQLHHLFDDALTRPGRLDPGLASRPKIDLPLGPKI
jgi:Domain of unknown function (DUF4159)